MAKQYGLAIVGGGITGLSAGIAYALNGDMKNRPAVLLEKEKTVGGMVTSFKREGFLFDTTQIIPNPGRILDYLGVDLELKRFDGYYARVFIADPATQRATRIDIPSGLEPFKQMLKERYPDDTRKIERLIDYSESMYDQLNHLRMNPGVIEKLGMALRCTKIVRQANRTFSDYLDGFGIQGDELRELFDVFAAFSGLSCERVAALMVVGAMVATMRGSYRPTKGFLKMPHAMRKRFEALGGEVRTRSKVVKIHVRGGRVEGVQLANGETLLADHVVTTADTKVSLLDLVGDDAIRAEDPRYADHLDGVKMSASGMSISLGLDDRIDLADLGMDCGYNVITTGKGTFEKLFQHFDRGEPGFTDTCFHTAVICPSLTTGGKQTLVIRAVPMPLADWTELRSTEPEAYTRKKREWADFFIGRVETYLIPDLRNHIEVMDVASPATFARYSGSPTGSNYDMAPYPENFGPKRLRMKTPIQGLLLPKFSHGILSALQGGLHAADAVCGGTIMNGRYSLGDV